MPAQSNASRSPGAPAGAGSAAASPPARPPKISNNRPPASPVAPCPPKDPKCCGQTHLIIKCSHGERGVIITLPKSSAAAKRGKNREGNYLEVISTFDAAKDRDSVSVDAKGPRECPPGTKHMITLSNGEAFVVPGSATAEVFATLPPLDANPDILILQLIGTHAPWNWKESGVGHLSIDGESCKNGGDLHADVFVYPNISCSGSVGLTWKKNTLTEEIELEGSGCLKVAYNGSERELDLKYLKDKFEQKCLVSWDDIIKLLHDLDEGWSLAKQESGAGTFTAKWPVLSVKAEGSLYEKKGSPDVDSKYSMILSADPLLDLDYNYNLLPWMLGAIAGAATANPLLGFVARKGAEKFLRIFKAGIFLGVNGTVKLDVRIESSLLTDADCEVGSAEGEITFRVEASAEKEVEGILASVSASGGIKAHTSIEVSGKCIVKRKPEQNRWTGKAGWGGLKLTGFYKSSAKIVGYGFSSEDEVEVEVFAPRTWLDTEAKKRGGSGGGGSW